MSNQEIQYGKQPPKDADVQFGKTPEADTTTSSNAGDSDPGIVGVVPVYAGGDEVPDSTVGEGHDASDAADYNSGDEEASEDSEASQDAEETAPDAESGKA